MKKITLLLLGLLSSLTCVQAQKANNIPIDAVHFPDEIFRNYISVQFDLNHDDILSKKEIAKVYIIDIDGFWVSKLDGIAYFTNLQSLGCYNNSITSLEELKRCRNLQSLSCGLNQHLSSIDLSGCVNLQTLSIYHNHSLASVNLSGCVNLQTLSCIYNNSLESLDLSGCANVSLQIENNPNLTTLNLNGCTQLANLPCRNNNNLESISLENCSSLRQVLCDNNQLTSLDLSARTSDDFYLTYSNNKRYIPQNENRTFNLNLLPNFDISRTEDWDGGFLTDTILTFIRDTVTYSYQAYPAKLITIPFMLIYGEPENPDVPTDPENPDDSDNPDSPDDPDAPDNHDDPNDPDNPDNPDNPDTPNNPDDPNEPDVPEFGGLPISEEYVAAQFDRNANDSLSERERATVSEINVAGLGIGSLQGIEHFPYLEKLDCSRNHLTALDLSGNNALQTLYCYENSLFVELDDWDGFDLRSLPDFEPERAENWKGGVISGDTLRFMAKEVSYAYRHRLAGGTGVPETVSFTLTSDKQPDEPTANEDAETTAATALFRVHPMPFRHTLHIETALDLKCVSLYNMQARLCRRYRSGFDALPADGLEPGLYLLLLETADGATYRIKAVKK